MNRQWSYINSQSLFYPHVTEQRTINDKRPIEKHSHRYITQQRLVLIRIRFLLHPTHTPIWAQWNKMLISVCMSITNIDILNSYWVCCFPFSLISMHLLRDLIHIITQHIRMRLPFFCVTRGAYFQNDDAYVCHASPRTST